MRLRLYLFPPFLGALVAILGACEGGHEGDTAEGSTTEEGHEGNTTEEGEGHEGEGGEGEDGEEEELTPVSIDVSIQLLGSICFMMGIFYVTNHSDPDLRARTWSVLSDTISIFSAVLFYQAFNGMIEVRIVQKFELEDDNAIMLVGFAHMMFWYFVLQFVLALITGTLPSCGKNLEDDDDYLELKDEQTTKRIKKELKTVRLERMELNLKCFAILLGHITGFAFIDGFGNVQQLFKDSTLAVLCVVAMVVVSCIVLFRVMDIVRDIVSAGDGKVEEEEKKWDEATEETEDDVLGLAVSFLAVQAARMVISGACRGRFDLPNKEGHSDARAEGDENPTLEIFALFGLGILLAGGLMVAADAPGDENKQESKKRMKAQLRTFLGMSLSWCMLFALKMLLTDHKVTGLISAVVLALAATFLAFVTIFVLDKLADADFTGASIDEGLICIQKSMGVLIGFCWERSFDDAVEVIADYDKLDWMPEDVLKIIMASAVCGVVVPAWRCFILPQIVCIEEAEEREKQEEEEMKEDTEEQKLKSELLQKLQKDKEAGGHPKKQRQNAEKHQIDHDKKHIKFKLEQLREELLLLAKHKKGVRDKAPQLKAHEARNHELESAVDRFNHEIDKLDILVEKHARAKRLHG